jgi:hypothetical protein
LLTAVLLAVLRMALLIRSSCIISLVLRSGRLVMRMTMLVLTALGVMTVVLVMTTLLGVTVMPMADVAKQLSVIIVPPYVFS